MTVSADRVAPRKNTAAHPTSFYVGAAIRYGLLILAAIIAFTPFILSFLGTFKTNLELTSFPPQIMPQQWLFDNWVRVWNFTLPTVDGQVLPRWLFNSVWLAVLNVALRLFFCSLAAYAFARLEFPGRNIIFAVVIASMAFPGEVSLIPGFVFYTRLEWVNTYWPLIVPDLVIAIGVFMLTQFFKAIPKDLEEAAYIDGMGRFGVYWRIILPLSRPILITLAILQFQAVWNDFVRPLLFLQRPEIMTLTVGMNFFQNQFSNDFSAILVGAMFNAIPVLLLFFFLNKYFLESASYSGLAGQ
ncbi:MAG: carbohydrate ABC transporter permease [Chloroflexi bacterium AL-W]|nr:carbohydrate ABC transporter permease [Chloroflexi bacterium AL-N1]NOK67851.1 carbohydrate ABC transporter permease [Chloroflexi bacterium AL-N10]NOK75380.1 carbohydrate ABC transporter permease [Chloroflexi bacterium AL-N5]NOK82168.1 carbohydrate ABC transporter permease [Chloroflexi bacterium AL-W]NOK90013.1 carbohydrate ABC transporter permease [Chloroflexi bacterium AL-N15]